MKLILIGIVAVAAISFAACNNGGNQSSEKKDTVSADNMAKMDTSNTASTAAVNAPVVKASFTNVNADAAAQIKEIASHYFHIKHALLGNDAAEAKSGATMLLQVISQFDNSLLPADQKTAYVNQISAIKEHAQVIIASTDIEAERMHFAELSTHMYELIKAFGAGKKIYYDHCPMALNSKGASWLSESADIQNPYFKGTAMNACAKVEQVIE